jgi:hypothetical protein
MVWLSARYESDGVSYSKCSISDVLAMGYL